METIPKDPILQHPPETLQIIRKTYNLDKLGQMDEAIDILDEWIKKQNHLVKKDFCRGYLERTIISSKGSVERAKSKIDKICTLRTLLPHFYKHFMTKEDLAKMQEDMYLVPLPKLTEDYYRVGYMRMSTKATQMDIMNFYKFNVVVFEYIRANDYVNGFICVSDLRDVNIMELIKNIYIVDMRQISTLVIVLVFVFEYIRANDYVNGIICVSDLRDVNIMELIKNINIVDMRQISTLVIEGFGLRVKGMHFLTASTAIDMLLTILKQVVSKKIGDRIMVHKTLDSLYQHVPKEILPEECGGNERSFKKLNDEWLDILSSKEHVKYMKDIKEANTDERCRHSDTFNDQYMGMPGTFRTLKVD